MHPSLPNQPQSAEPATLLHMTTFALVHGAWSGAWCWERLAPELEARGHRVVAPELPCDDPAATMTTYADVVVRALEGEPDDLVLVGHSLAGCTIPLVAARRPVGRLVYLCAIVPIPGRSHGEQLRAEPDTLVPGALDGLGPPDALDRTSWADEEATRRALFADCPDDVARDAFARLRPQARAPYREPCPLDAFPPAPATYVRCAEDRVIDGDWSRRVASGRLEAGLVDLPGDHSPMLSRPAALAGVLSGPTSAASRSPR